MRYRTAYAIVIGAVVAADPAAAADDAPPLEAKMQCERAAEPGRVRCSVEVKPGAARTITWADVAILQLPEFASALKGRIGPDDATAKDPSGFKWAFGLVAKRAGSGEARARVRAVTCRANGNGCIPQLIDVRAMIDVGG